MIANLKILNDIFFLIFKLHQMQIHMKNINEQKHQIEHNFITTNMNNIDIVREFIGGLCLYVGNSI